jgi:hypothetical protein
MKKDKFYDINHFPNQKGMLLFPISISRIGNAQNPRRCFDNMQHFVPKIKTPSVALTFIYGDSLYLYDNGKSADLKNKYLNLIHAHKFGFENQLKREPLRIPQAFSYTTWNELILRHKDFLRYFAKLKIMYKEDSALRKAIKADSGAKPINANQINFILEETLLFALILHRQIRLPNDFIQEKHEWILYCYPGKPLRTEIYLHQKNLLKLEKSDNIYQDAWYDLEEKKLYKIEDIDLEKF